MEIYKALDKLVGYAEERLLLPKKNEIYTRNTLLMILGLESYEESGAEYAGRAFPRFSADLTKPR